MVGGIIVIVTGIARVTALIDHPLPVPRGWESGLLER